jgi:hypothetical protein
MNFFRISPRSILPVSWGDYGDILQHGMTAHSSRVDGRLALERTGPYIPPITLPGIGDLILTFGTRKLLEGSGLTGFSFLPVEKTLIVELPWETWDLSKDEPPEIPESGEPEDYVLVRPHSPTAAAAIGDIWEVVVPRTATVLRPTPVVRSYKDLRLDLSTWNGADLIRAQGYGSTLFSEGAKDWFSEQFGEYVQFDPFPTM